MENNAPGRQERRKMVEDLRGLIRGSKGMIFLNDGGLDSIETTELRKRMRGAQSRLRMVKNRLMKIACDEEKVEGCSPWLKANTVVAFATDDAVAALKALSAYSVEHEKLKFKGGVIEGKAVGPDGLRALAALPGRHDLLTMVAYGMKGPMTKAARDFKAVYTKMALLLKEAAKKAPK
jgi:large subunit ribosomal protein L10